MKKNDELTLECLRLGSEMEGVFSAGGMAVFAPGALQGETAQVRIEKMAKNYAFGKVLKVENPSCDRVTPRCGAFTRCGGCSAQHMNYEATLAAKRQQVEDCFARIGHLKVEAMPVLGMKNPWHYRNKTSMPVGGTAKQPLMGFFSPRSHRIVDIADCAISMEESNVAARCVRDWIVRYGIAPYNEETHTGLLRHLMVRVSRARQVMVVLVVNGRSVPHTDELLVKLRGSLPGLCSLCLNMNDKRTNVILGPDTRVLWGSNVLEDTLCGSVFKLSPHAFFQVNPEQTEVLYRVAAEFAALTLEETAADIYCGAGTISLLLAKNAKEVVGVEIVPAAIENANANAAANGVTNTRFLCGAAEEVLPDLVRKGLRPDVIVIDPPRKGVEPQVVDAILQAAPRRVVYVSCNPATQARDAALFYQGGYKVIRCQPVDMFPWTSGVENVILLSK